MLEKAYQQQSLIYTQKHAIKVGNDAGMVVYTYLNPMLEKSSFNEEFILSIAPAFLKINSMSVMIDGKEAAIMPIDKDSEELKLILQSLYAKYYLVIYPGKIDKQSLTSKVCINKNCFNLITQKIVKSLFFRAKDSDK